MVIKRGRFGEFLACSRYPECKGSRPILKKVGVACPKDGGEIVEKRTRKGRTFYACANYPDCDFTSWSRPLPRPCPTCGGLVVGAGRGKAKCTACDWNGETEAEGEQEMAKVSA
jgi:DNA topoisomerase-1